MSRKLGTLTRLIAVAVVLSSGVACAADLPPAPAPPQAPAVYVPIAPAAYNWGGVYVGINGGWGLGTADWTTSTGAGNATNDRGGVVGGTFGVNWQIGGFVFGVEGDWDYSGINTGTSSTICATFGTCQTENNWLSTLRGRFGYAVDRILFYGTAGGVFGNVQSTVNGITTTHTQTGWTAGVGVETAFAEHWTAKFEYLYADLGTENASGTCIVGACAGLPVSARVGLADNLIRAGVNYKF